mgnify:CR=1 FL=1
MQKYAFLDRDGVINEDFGYVHSMKNVVYLKGSIDGMINLNEKHFKIHIITNQAGIARGYFSEKEFKNFMRQFIQDLFSRGVIVDGYSFCPHHADASLLEYKKECFFRKPNPGMILKKIQENSVDLNKSILIGDKISDIKAGTLAGLKNLYFMGKQSSKLYVEENFRRVAGWGELIQCL